MSEHPQPSYGHYRRVQLARYIINQELGRAGRMEFDPAGHIRGFGFDVESLLHTR